MKIRHAAIALPLLLGGVFATSLVLKPADRVTVSAGEPAAPPPATTMNVSGYPIGDIALGAEDAPITMIEYASFTCSHCAAFHRDVWPALKAEYIDTGKVRFIQREVFFDQPGLWAGQLAWCGGEAKYYPVSSMLLDGQRNWMTAGATGIGDNLRKIGRIAGMTDAQIDACWADEKFAHVLVEGYKRNASRDGVTATPSFIIDGEKVSNLPWTDMKALIEGKLAK